MKKKVCFLSIVFSVIFLGISIYMYLGWQSEKRISERFFEEYSTVNGLKLDNFRLWDGSSIVNAHVENKGEVMLWYGEDGLTSIGRIGTRTTSFDCYGVNNAGKRGAYAYELLLDLKAGSPFLKWFSIEVSTLQNLVDSYDLVEDVLDDLPRYQMNILERRRNNNALPEDFDQDYVLYREVSGRKVGCELYL